MFEQQTKIDKGNLSFIDVFTDAPESFPEITIIKEEIIEETEQNVEIECSEKEVDCEILIEPINDFSKNEVNKNDITPEFTIEVKVEVNSDKSDSPTGGSPLPQLGENTQVCENEKSKEVRSATRSGNVARR